MPAPATSLVLAAGEVHDEAYVVNSRPQIHAALTRLRDSRELTVVHFGARGEFVVTMVLAVDGLAREVLLDVAPDPDTNARLLASSPLLVLAHQGGVRIQFEVEGAVAATFDGAPALRIPFPGTIGRFERRACFRVRIPRSRVVVCELGPQDGAAMAMTRVLDLSCTGARLHGIDALSLETGTGPPARLHLEGEPALEVALEIRRVGEAGSFSGKPERVIGARFVGLSAAAEMRIGRYLNRLQRDARRIEAGQVRAIRSADS